MPRARQIQDQRKSVQNIRKVTRTMEMIATARYRKGHRRVDDIRPYTDGISRIVHNLVQAGSAMADQPLLRTRPDLHRDALMVIASNRGMCGGYNGAVLRLAQMRHDELIEQGRQVDVYAVGIKAIDFLRVQGIGVCWSRPQFGRHVPVEEVADIAEGLIERFCGDQLASVHVAYTHYVSSSVQHPTIDQLLPLGQLGRARSAIEQGIGRETRAIEYDFLPAPETILSQVLPRAVCLRLYRAMLDALVSEQVARMTAMRLATENAEEMIRELTMQANRARQSRITAELAEVTQGSEALG